MDLGIVRPARQHPGEPVSRVGGPGPNDDHARLGHLPQRRHQRREHGVAGVRGPLGRFVQQGQHGPQAVGAPRVAPDGPDTCAAAPAENRRALRGVGDPPITRVGVNLRAEKRQDVAKSNPGLTERAGDDHHLPTRLTQRPRDRRRRDRSHEGGFSVAARDA